MVRIFLAILVLGSGLTFSPGSAQGEETSRIEGVVEMQKPGRVRRRSPQYAQIQADTVAPRPPDLAVVYLTAPDLEIPPASDRPQASLVQKGLQFFPSVLPIQTGTEVFFPNEDDTYHNVFSYSPAGTFDKGRYKRGETPPSEVFPTSGEIQIFCEVHEHMRATILVLDTPYFTTSDPDGSFVLDNIPPGNYTLQVWWNTRTKSEQAITVTTSPITGLELKP